jgi:hypothetical protein
MTTPPNTAAIGARLNVSGTLEWRDAQGNVLRTTHLSGQVPLESLGLTVDQAQTLIKQQEQSNDHHRQ